LKTTMKWTLLTLAFGVVLISAGCHKKAQPAPAAPAPPPAAAPTASISVSPNSIASGGSATLSWTSTNATNVTIDGIGAVASTGTQTVTPAASTTYHVTATGPGGSVDANARLTVTAAMAPPAPAAPDYTEEQLFAQSVKDIYFDYDKYDLRAEDKATIDADAAFLKAHPSIRFTIEGHCDERGSTDYNLALGDNRANAARTALVNAGIPASQIRVISYGKEKPFCTESTESCWQQNRRAHFVYGQK